MPSRVEDINTKVDEAIAARETGDFTTALAKLDSAILLLGSMPDSRDEMSELKWNTQSLVEMRKNMQRSVSAATGVRRTLVEYRDATS